MEKRLTKHISYLPKESIEIHAVKRQWKTWSIVAVVVGVIGFLTLVLSTGIFGGFLFSAGFIGLFVNLIIHGINPSINYIQFTEKRVILKQHKENTTEDQALSHFLKSPTYLDVIVKQKPKDLMEITFEQYGEKIGKTTVPGEELTYLLDSLNDLLGLEIKETRSTKEKEDVLYLRPIDSDENLMPSYLKVVDNPLRLIVNPTSNVRNFIINNQRNIIKNANGKTVHLHEITDITLFVSGTTVVMTALLQSNKFEEIIKFKTKKYSIEIIKKDLQNFIDFLKTKPNLQHIQFAIQG
ncbi:MAG: hypothetical protein AB8G11_20930 [Saprospiraceae bacterium]